MIDAGHLHDVIDVIQFYGGWYPAEHVNLILNSGGLAEFQKRNQDKAPEALARLQQTALQNGNIFGELMDTVRSCSLGQITQALYDVGGQYRRNM